MSTFKKFFSNLLLEKEILVILLICLTVLLVLRFIISFLKKRFDLSDFVTKISNCFIALFFLGFLYIKIHQPWLQRIILCFQLVLLFVIFKFLIIDYYLKDFLVKKRNKKINHIIIDIIKFVVIVFFIMIFLRKVLNLNLITILTPSAILTAIVGLSMKDTIGSLISGIIIQIEKPFDIGDWIQIKDMVGRVMEITWRYTKIKTISDVYIVVPNNNISTDNIINYSKPSSEFEVWMEIGVSYESPPVKVKRAIYEILEKNRYVVKDRYKDVLLKSYGSSSINYQVVFSISDYYFKRKAIDEIYSSIWYQFKKYGIVIPFPIRTLVFKKEEKEIDISWIMEGLKKNQLFKDAKIDVLEFLAKYGNILEFLPGEEVVKEGEEGSTMFIIIKGEFDVLQEGKVVATLREGDFFGEISLISGGTRNATVQCKEKGIVLEIDRMLFQVILEKDTFLKNMIFEKFHERIQKEIEKKKTQEVIQKEKSNIFENLKKFFGFGK